MANLIGSLRLISTFDWSEFFESVSLVEQVLQRDPAGVYGRMDFRSRDRYRHAVEELAAPTGEGQLLLALKSVERARQAHVQTPDAREAHVGYHLIGRGRRQFERSVAWQPSSGQRLRRLSSRSRRRRISAASRRALPLLVAAAVSYAWWHGWRGAALVFVALLAPVPASELTIQLLQRLISYLIPPRRLPRLELDAVPPSARTMVIVPTLLDSVERVGDMIAHLEVQALGNLDPHIHFAILSDFRDAPTETLPRDAEILEAAREGIAALNANTPTAATGSSCSIACANGTSRRTVDGVGAEARQDRGVQPPAARRHRHELCGVRRRSGHPAGDQVLHHARQRYAAATGRGARADRHHHAPAQPRPFNPGVGRVTEGYGILQPRVSVTFMSAAGSLFARLYSGHTGVDPYYDGGLRHLSGSLRRRHLHGQGTVRRRCVHCGARRPGAGERAPLPRSLRRPARAGRARVRRRAGRRYPSTVLSHARRQHRWIRGDWQILFWLFPFVPSRRGLKRNTLPVIGRWKILDNLRRSLSSPTLLVLLVAGWMVLPGPRWFWTLTVMGVAASQLLPVIARLLVGPAERSRFRCSSATCAAMPRPRWRRSFSA